MTADAFTAWLAEMKDKRLSTSDADAGRKLGISANSVVQMKRNGADTRTALACRALLHELDPYR